MSNDPEVEALRAMVEDLARRRAAPSLEVPEGATVATLEADGRLLVARLDVRQGGKGGPRLVAHLACQDAAYYTLEFSRSGHSTVIVRDAALRGGADGHHASDGFTVAPDGRGSFRVHPDGTVTGMEPLRIRNNDRSRDGS